MSIASFAPRTILYAALMAVTGFVMLYALISRSSMNMSVLHVRAPLFTETAEGGIRNGYTLRFSTSSAKRATSRSKSAASRAR